MRCVQIDTAGYCDDDTSTNQPLVKKRDLSVSTDFRNSFKQQAQVLKPKQKLNRSLYKMQGGRNLSFKSHS